MKEVLFSSLIVFMCVVCCFHLAGGIFGVFAGNTFTNTLTNTFGIIQGIDSVVIKPANKVLKFFGIRPSTIYGLSYVYAREESESQFLSKYIPLNAKYCAALVDTYLVSNDKKAPMPGMYTKYYIFFDSEGLPISCLIFDKYNGLVLDGEKLTGSDIYFKSADVGTSYLNVFSRYLYANVNVSGTIEARPFSYTAYQYEPFFQNEFIGSFRELHEIFLTLDIFEEV